MSRLIVLRLRFASMVIGGAHPGPPDAAVWTRLDRVRDYLGQGMQAYVAWRESQTGDWPPAFQERVLGNDPQALTAFSSAPPDHGSECGEGQCPARAALRARDTRKVYGLGVGHRLVGLVDHQRAKFCG